jgi:hypothetical protein
MYTDLKFRSIGVDTQLNFDRKNFLARCATWIYLTSNPLLKSSGSGIKFTLTAKYLALNLLKFDYSRNC